MELFLQCRNLSAFLLQLYLLGLQFHCEPIELLRDFTLRITFLGEQIFVLIKTLLQFLYFLGLLSFLSTLFFYVCLVFIYKAFLLYDDLIFVPDHAIESFCLLLKACDVLLLVSARQFSLKLI